MCEQHPHRVILERSEGSRWGRREVYKHNLVGRCLGAAVLMGLNRSSRREQAPALRVCVYILCFDCAVCHGSSWAPTPTAFGVLPFVLVAAFYF